jgi:putative hydrolase of the HAD superfamily
MIAHVVVDYGGVISHPQPGDEVEHLAAVASIEAGEFVERYWAYRPEYDRGQASDAYWSLVLRHTPGADLLARLNEADLRSWTHLDGSTLGLLRRINHRGVPLSLLSNAPAVLAEWIDGQAWADCFSHRLYSCRLGAVKPEPVIFRRTLEIVGAPPEAVLFVDDRADNTAAARALGMATITFASPSDLGSLA